MIANEQEDKCDRCGDDPVKEGGLRQPTDYFADRYTLVCEYCAKHLNKLQAKMEGG